MPAPPRPHQLVSARMDELRDRFEAALDTGDLDAQAVILDESTFLIALLKDLLDLDTSNRGRDAVLDYYRSLAETPPHR